MTKNMDSRISQNEHLTVSEVAKIMRVSQKKVYLMVKDNQIPHYKFGVTIRFDKKKFLEWHNSQYHPVTEKVKK